ncbi:hypothetical protein Dalk_3228 [Desulfatibacillum aliphaticivorans]|uniref:Uncharacterized protein n=1 Tax=Desulfatibacillum aliphaticivorans TaxID=218208 RepID=B8FGK9_DESAL|nr:hypothetical protein [Desulfatibacillum aliphaticivorans]ACL04918.1 hypothetical protein Dalk_3228 [Desulfatibacillum aliphaticivorans]
MKKYTIEIDEIIMSYLKEKAEPFVDTPNTVLHKLLFNTSTDSIELKFSEVRDKGRMPKALSQTLEVIEEVVKNHHSRPKATMIVAERNRTATQTVIDKYCRQLGKSASEVDLLLREPGLHGFQSILLSKFPKYRDVIMSLFNNLNKEENEMEQPVQVQEYYPKPIASDRKKRDTALEASLKYALGERLKDQFGLFELKGQSQLVFDGVRVLCKFSSFHDDKSRWFWGVSKSYWQSWEPTDLLALIMENEDRDSYSFILLSSDEAQDLFNLCSESAGEKKINMRIYSNDNVVRIQEWKEFDVVVRSQSLDVEW